jgi:hypothetical protein
MSTTMLCETQGSQSRFRSCSLRSKPMMFYSVTQTLSAKIVRLKVRPESGLVIVQPKTIDTITAMFEIHRP